MVNTEKIDLAHWIMDSTRKEGADEVSIVLHSSRSVDIGFRDGMIENLGESTNNNVTLEIYKNQRYSSHETCDMRRDALTHFIREAVSATGYLSPDKFRQLPDPKYYPREEPVELQQYDQQIKRMRPDDRLNMARQIEKAALKMSSRIVSVTAGYSDNDSSTIRLQSNGFEGQTQRSSFSAGVEVTVDDGAGGKPEDWYYASTCWREDLPEPAFIAQRAVERAENKIGAEKLASGTFDMIVENQAVGRLIYMMRDPLSGRALHQKRSYLDGRLDTAIASDKLTIIDDPFIPRSMGSKNYDGEGMAVQKRIIIDKGILRSYYIDAYNGRKLGLKPTSGDTTNLIFDLGTKSLAELIKSVQRGILVNNFIGGNANGTTGDFSLGVMGQLIEDGRIVKPVNEMNLSGNALDFWLRLKDVGNDPRPFSSWKMPSMLFQDIFFSGL